MRPEHLTLDGEVNALTGTIDYVEPTGGQTFVNLVVDGQPVMVAVPGSTDVREEGQLTVHAAPEFIHVFDGKTGLRLNA